MLRRNVQLFILLCSTSFAGNAQNLFRDGYIVKNSGDTLNGLINIIAEKEFPKKITFRRFELASPFVFSPNDIKSFGYINGAVFESKKVNNLYLFLKVRIKGNISIFEFESRLFVEKKPYGLTEVNIIPVTCENGQVFTDTKTFFKELFASKFEINIADNSKKEEIVAQVVKYNNLDGNNNQFQYLALEAITKNWAIIEVFQSVSTYGVLFGSSAYNLSIIPDAPDSWATNKNRMTSINNSSTGYFIGFYYKKPFTQLKRLHLYLEASIYSKHSFYSYNESQAKYSSYLYRNESYLDFWFAKIPVTLQYKIPLTIINSNVELGFSYNYIINANAKRIEDEIYTSKNTVTIKEINELVFKKAEISGLCGLNFNFNVFARNIIAGLRYEFSIQPWISLNSAGYYKNSVIQKSNQTSFYLGYPF